MTERTQSAPDIAGQAGQLPADLLSGFAEAIPIPVVLLTPETRIRHANAAFVQALDIEKEHYLHKKFPCHWLMHAQEGLAQLRELLYRAAQPGANSEPVHLSLRSSDGSEILTEIHARPLPSLDQGTDALMVVTFKNVGLPQTSPQTDLSEKDANWKSLQEELERSEERFRILFEYAPDGYYLCDLDGRFIDGNRAAEDMVGYQREELIGQSFLKLNLLPKGQLQRAAKILVKSAIGKPTGPDEFTLNRKDGAQVAIEIHTYPVRIQGQVLVLGIARNITERKHTEAKLRDSETKYRQLHESSRDGCAATDLKGRLLESNTAFREMLGYTEEELGRLTYADITPHRWHGIEAQIVKEQVFTKGYSDLYEKEYLRKDGTVFPIELRVYLKKDPEGRPAGMWAIVRDISKRRRAEEELRQSDRRFKAMTDSAQDAIMMMDPQGRITFYNKTAEAMFGWAATEAMGKDLHTLIAPQRHHDAYRHGFVHFQQTGKGGAIGRTLELTALRKDRTEFPIEISLAGVELEGEWHAIGIVRDITERKQAQEAILREKAFSDSVINSLPGVFYMFNEEGKHVWWNKNLEDVTEYSSDEIPSIHPTELFGEADRERVKEATEEAFRKGETTVEADLVAKSGRKTPFFFTGVRVERNGKPYLVGLGIDITERRKAEVILEKLNIDLESSVQELERSNRELRDFAHITAHDLKAPLRGIGTLVDWLDQDYGEQIGPEGKENLHLLQSRVDRMGRLISGILRYSEIGHNDQPVEILDTHALTAEVIEQIAAPDHIEICIENTLPSVPAERTRLTQVLQNLITNAIKYIDKPQGKIHISARDDGDFWEFCVADNGPGIKAKHFARIFQMFQTLSSSDRCESTGLGLAVVKKIVDMYGGRIWLESEMGQGSAFFFTLPKHQKAAGKQTD
jgi:PAS domain S-box-containing protein